MVRTLLILARRAAGPAWAITAELAWHLAGQAWAFAVLAAGLGWLATRLPAAIASATSKAYAVEARVNGLVPAVSNALNNAATAQSTASSAQSTASSAQSTANNALPRGGGTVTGDLHVNGRLYLASGSMPQSLGGGAVQNNDGFGGGVWTATQAAHLSSWQDNYNLTVNFVNNMRNTLNAAGVL